MPTARTAFAPALSFPSWTGGRLLLAGLSGLAGLAGPAAAGGPDDGKVHVTYWEKWVSFEGQAMQTVIAEFNRSQDRIVVDYLPTSQIDRKMIVATAGGDPPDLVGLWAYNLASFADAEALRPLDDFIRADGLTPEQWLARYYPVYARMIQHSGRIYAGISTPATIAFYWNKTLFREAGLDPDRPPRTLAELNDYARRLTKHDPATGAITQMGFLPQDPGWWPWIFCLWFGGELFDGRQITLATNPKNLEAMRWIEGFTRDNGADAVKVFTSGAFGAWASAQAPFMSGKIAMVFQGVWYDNYIKQYKPGLDYGVGPWPEAAAGVKDFCLAEADVLAIPRGAHHAREAWEFIKYVNSNNPRARTREELRGGELLCSLQQKLSPLREWSPYFEQHNPHPNIAVFRQLAASPNARATPDIGVWQEYYREFIAAFERVRLLEATPEEALGFAHRRMTESWERYRRSLERHGQVPPAAPGHTP
jgi:ABC-type glycerol-3-phosphate transport system substrate-binding protein